jgi:8-hydroxy-5-deazaflavin:NADPH oxidoreductase
MKVGIIGAGRIGGGLAGQLAGAGHEVLLSFRREAAALEQAGPLTGKIVIDTTNQYGAPPYTKSFNTLTSAFQAETAGRGGTRRVVQWLCGDDAGAKEIVARLIQDAGFVPVDLGGTAGCAVMEAPRRPGAVYGEEYRLPDAMAVAEAVRAGRPIPPTPHYDG